MIGRGELDNKRLGGADCKVCGKHTYDSCARCFRHPRLPLPPLRTFERRPEPVDPPDDPGAGRWDGDDTLDDA